MNALALPTPSDPATPAVDLTRYTGPEKAAIILMALGEDAKKLWEVMDEEEIKEASQAMASLGVVPSAVVEALVHEFIQRLSGAGSIMGSVEQTQRMLMQILPKEKVASLMEEIRGPAGRNIWDKLANVHETVLASYLKNEYPQTVAVVLAKVRPEHAAKVLAELPQDFAADCVMRMLAMEPVQRDILEKVETTLRTEFMSNLARTSKRDSHELMADIFNNFDRQTESRFMGALEGKSNESADRIRALMFVFEDLGKLDSGGIRHASHEAVQRIYFADEMTFAQSANGRVAGHLANRCEAMCEEGSTRTDPRRCSCGLATCVSATNDNDIESVCHRTEVHLVES